jgi:hypothetical protein
MTLSNYQGLLFTLLSQVSRYMESVVGHCLKGSLTRDFRLQVFFMNQCPPGPQVFHWGHLELFLKFAEIFANESLSPVSLTPAINPCHGFSVIAGVIDTGHKFITGVVVTGYKFITGVVVTGDKSIAGNNVTGEQFIVGDKNKDAMEVGSCQGSEKIEGDKTAISPAAKVGHGRQ